MVFSYGNQDILSHPHHLDIQYQNTNYNMKNIFPLRNRKRKERSRDRNKNLNVYLTEDGLNLNSQDKKNVAIRLFKLGNLILKDFYTGGEKCHFNTKNFQIDTISDNS